MRRRLLLSSAALVAIACVVLLVLPMLPRHGVRQVDFARIHNGMAPAEVERILGRPPDRNGESRWAAGGHAPDTMEWDGQGGFGFVAFRDGVVSQALWIGSEPESLSGKIRRWLGWREEIPVLEEIN